MDRTLTLRDRQNYVNGVQLSDLEELQKSGQELYRKKQYEAALERFSLAIKKDVEPPLTVYDNRAATYTKLGNLQAALSDGHKMIRRERTNSMGYLRAGKILQLMKNSAVAQNLYEMGLSRVAPSDSNFLLLRKMYEQVRRLVAPPQAIDPFKALPVELVEMALQKLEFHDICYCLRVSKAWQQLLISMKDLWSNLDFITAKRPVSLGAIRKYIKSGKGIATQVTLPRFGTSAEGIPRYITTRCKELQELRIIGGLVGETMLQAVPCALHLKTLIVGAQCQVTCDFVDQLLAKTQSLECAEFYSVQSSSKNVLSAGWDVDLPNLKALTMDCRKPPPNPRRTLSAESGLISLNKLVSRIPNVRKLVLCGHWQMYCPLQGVFDAPDLSGLSSLEVLDLNQFGALQSVRFPASLQDLNISKCRFVLGEIEANQFTQLSRFSAADYPLTFAELKIILEGNKGNLSHLNLSGFHLTLEDFAEIIESGYLSRVQELKLNGADVDDNLLILLAANAPSMRSLYLAQTKITGVAVKALVNGLSSTLQYLFLNHCDFINVDAIEWGRSKGVKIDFSCPDTVKPGKRIRLS